MHCVVGTHRLAVVQRPDELTLEHTLAKKIEVSGTGRSQHSLLGLAVGQREIQEI